MTASRLDVEWDRGADWGIILDRRTRSGVVLPATSGAWEVREVDAPSSSPALLTADGVVREDGRVLVEVSRAQVDALPRSSYEYRVPWRDGASGMELILLRGYITITDNAGGTG